MKPVVLNHPDHLPTFFGPLTVIGTATEEIVKYRALHASNPVYARMAATQPTNVKVTQQPLLSCSKEVQQAYQTNNFDKIKAIEDKANSDLNPIYENIIKKGDSAWVKVKSSTTGEEYYMSWSNSAAVWSYTPSIRASTAQEQLEDPNAKFQAVSQFGTYSSSSDVTGTQKFDLGLPEKAIESVLSLIISQTLSSFLPEGLNFLAAQFAERLSKFAVEKGLEFFKFLVPEAWLGPVTMSIVFTLVFIGLKMLYDWLNRQYTIRVQVFNWDNKYDWQLTTQAVDNAVNPGKDKNTTKLDISIDKMSGSVTYPPDFDPKDKLDCIVYYAVIIYENDKTFARGCSFAIQAIRDKDIRKGFTYAFQCPRFSDNAQYLVGSVVEPAQFLQQASSHWTSSLSVDANSADNTPISVTMSGLQGAANNTYDVNIQINQKSK